MNFHSVVCSSGVVVVLIYNVPNIYDIVLFLLPSVRIPRMLLLAVCFFIAHLLGVELLTVAMVVYHNIP